MLGLMEPEFGRINNIGGLKISANLYSAVLRLRMPGQPNYNLAYLYLAQAPLQFARPANIFCGAFIFGVSTDAMPLPEH